MSTVLFDFLNISIILNVQTFKQKGGAMELSKFIRDWRKTHGYTMQEFADKAGLTK